MASKEIIGHQQQFVEEIDYNEIKTEQVVLPMCIRIFFNHRDKLQETFLL